MVWFKTIGSVELSVHPLLGQVTVIHPSGVLPRLLYAEQEAVRNRSPIMPFKLVSVCWIFADLLQGLVQERAPEQACQAAISGQVQFWTYIVIFMNGCPLKICTAVSVGY